MTNLASLPEVLTVAEVAAYLRVNRRTVVTALILKHRLGAKKLGNQWRIPREALELYLANTRKALVTPSGEEATKEPSEGGQKE